MWNFISAIYILASYVSLNFQNCGTLHAKTGWWLPISYAELSFVPHILLCVGLWSRFLTYVEMLPFHTNIEFIYLWNEYLFEKKNQYHGEILDKSYRNIKCTTYMYLADIHLLSEQVSTKLHSHHTRFSGNIFAIISPVLSYNFNYFKL